MMASKRNNAFDLSKCVRPNILALQPYRCARDDYKDDGTNILLDANENAYGPSLAPSSQFANSNTNDSTYGNSSKKLSIDFLGLNRYPDPHQHELKSKLCKLRNLHTHTDQDLTPENLFVGVGSDEAIDALIRTFCRPGQDKILTCPPTYGMYAVAAQVNDVEMVKVPLDVNNNFQIQPDAINAALSADANIKLVYLCSPGNPTGTVIPKKDVERILLHTSWNGIVVLDEAYIDFAPDGTSLAEWVLEWPNLVVMQTLSKAFGLAGIRLGAAFTSTQIAALLNNLKAPYNISNPTSQIANFALQDESLATMRSNRQRILEQRQRLVEELPRIKGVGRFKGGADSNFLLVEILDKAEKSGQASNTIALAVYERLAETRGVVVRFRGKELGCEGCLRITVGTAEEVTRFLSELQTVLKDVHAGRISVHHTDQTAGERKANGVIA